MEGGMEVWREKSDKGCEFVIRTMKMGANW